MAEGIRCARARVRGGLPVIVRSHLIRANEADQSIQDGEFEFQLDAVHQGLERGLDRVAIGEFHDEKNDVEEDEEDIDGEDVMEGFAVDSVDARIEGDETEVADDLHHVEVGDDHFLDGESDEFDALHDPVGFAPDGGVGFGEIGAIGEDGGGDVKDDCVGDDHDEHPAEDSGIVDEKTQARVEDDSLARDHEIPSHG